MYLSQIPNQRWNIIEALVVAHDDMWLIVAQFVCVGKADFCTEEPQTSDEGCVEQIHTPFVCLIAKGIITNPLDDMKHKQACEKSRVVHYLLLKNLRLFV